jgi:hypothetical protein
MADFTQLVLMLREQMNATLSRSDALRPIAWLVMLLTILTIGTMYERGPDWILEVEAALLVGAILLYATAYLYCLLKNPDALRSEKYSLHKMALEHGLIGDSSTGLFEAREATRSDTIAVDPAKQIEHRS